MAIVVFLTTVNACCSKSDSCDNTDSGGIDLVNFTGNETDSVLVIPFQKGSNFLVHGDTLYTRAPEVAGTNKRRIDAATINSNYDYRIYVVKTHKAYDVYGYKTERKSCSKCFMKANNQYKEALSDYTVNGTTIPFSGTFIIIK